MFPFPIDVCLHIPLNKTIMSSDILHAVFSDCLSLEVEGLETVFWCLFMGCLHPMSGHNKFNITFFTAPSIKISKFTFHEVAPQ